MSVLVAVLVVLLPAHPAAARADVRPLASVQTLATDSASYVAGSSITATLTLNPGPVTLPTVVIAVRDPAGQNVDFPGQVNYAVGTTPRTLTQNKTFTVPGTYTYWAAYRRRGVWTDLAPVRTFSVSPDSASGPTAATASTTSSTSTAASAPAPDAAPMPLGPTGAWTLRFRDEFEGPSVDWSKWADTSSAEADEGRGNKGNQQLEWNVGRNCSVAGGVLAMTAKRERHTSRGGVTYDWTSCLLASSPSYAFQYGYIETRSKLPAAKGFWPAFWTWQAAGVDRWIETDVYEFYSDNHQRLYLTQHSGAGGGCQIRPASDPSSGYHVYGADIKPDGTDFYIDGRKACSIPGTSTGSTNILLDHFVYARIPPDASTTSARHEVDYVRAWQR